MVNLELATEESNFQFSGHLKQIDGSVYDLSSATSVYIQNRSTRPIREEVTTVTDAPNGIAQVIFSDTFLRIGENKIGYRVNWVSGKKSYTTTLYEIGGIKAS